MSDGFTFSDHASRHYSEPAVLDDCVKCYFGRGFIEEVAK